MDAGDLILLELSSFQLWWTRRLGVAPHLMLLTNLFPDHLDRHGTLEAYAEAKRAAFDGQRAGDVAVLPRDDAAVGAHGFDTAGGARRVWFGAGTDLHLGGEGGRTLHLPGASLDIGQLPLLGAHNRRNVLAAAAAATCLDGVTPEAILAGAHATEPLPHRLRTVATVGGVRFIDDSNGTNPTSTRCALEAVEAPTVLLLGGKDKGLAMDALLAFVAQRAKAVVGIGTTGRDLAHALEGRVPAAYAANMEDAVRAAYAQCADGDVVLLSPAHSSFDQYPSFVARGQDFARVVAELEASRG